MKGFVNSFMKAFGLIAVGILVFYMVVFITGWI